ncbi:MAG TPA: ABC transporter ATP-binding protein [Thermodesulfovibrionales bacterium]|nr:ABC transporter ATP-binding protein [Thermodesulfovibrionales bacterium]
MIEVKNLIKSYDINGQMLKAVDSVSFTVEKGEMVSIIGHSGSGKTTLLSLMGGLTRPNSGEVIIEGQNIWSMSDDKLSEFRNKKISFIYQFSSLIPTLTSLENITLPTAFGPVSEDRTGYAKELLRIVRLEDKVNSYPSHLSGGQQRRVAIARAFINRPHIILADEPTGDLDEETEKEVIDLFHAMNREQAITFIIVTHNKDIAMQARKQFKMINGVLSVIGQ